MPLTVAVLQVFRVGTAATMGHSPTLVATATGGVLRCTIQLPPGTATWTTTMVTPTETTPLRRTVSQCAASGINPLAL